MLLVAMPLLLEATIGGSCLYTMRLSQNFLSKLSFLSGVGNCISLIHCHPSGSHSVCPCITLKLSKLFTLNVSPFHTLAEKQSLRRTVRDVQSQMFDLRCSISVPCNIAGLPNIGGHCLQALGGCHRPRNHVTCMTCNHSAGSE